jgi:hypothetical protein
MINLTIIPGFKVQAERGGDGSDLPTDASRTALLAFKQLRPQGELLIIVELNARISKRETC